MGAKDEDSLVLKGDRNLHAGEGQRMLKILNLPKKKINRIMSMGSSNGQRQSADPDVMSFIICNNLVTFLRRQNVAFPSKISYCSQHRGSCLLQQERGVSQHEI
jgi:hypothetical protein